MVTQVGKISHFFQNRNKVMNRQKKIKHRYYLSKKEKKLFRIIRNGQYPPLGTPLKSHINLLFPHFIDYTLKIKHYKVKKKYLKIYLNLNRYSKIH